ncbi:2-amino-4-hydroxy-6-hydroxymethyldihydropteridine diphosphokinase [Halalkalibacter krulwichiae]|uniref:2-amino-4-hydroxy-6-hydroxymethyldihydropteridine diphosphokinase n=1 Tax=Halalkalibacter krulwichiae TaxID=199441 RepID=A0A1Y9THA4_9BACI|nr:2-amino-4-hydroxy-6-hydroxymethyldihydropteridine diphosphokinase [Halalkalibacter krulwichiae]ARK28475.1 2-amino-4-hydroxy-6-hydroxymethyldihydropteridine pyrophosphokinase [Halalkalibacter krulwichiae]
MNHDVYIALGSNIGDRYDHLKTAIHLLDQHERISVEKQSSIYETEPVGYVNQQAFLNMVIYVKTDLSPRELLDVTQAIETRCGRKRDIRWGPRTIDLDILLFDQENMVMETLSIPHPRMWERAFVMIPLMELQPMLKAPHSDKSLEEIYKALPDKEGVRKWNPGIVEEEFEPIASLKAIHKKNLQDR